MNSRSAYDRLKDQDREKYTAIGESDRFVMTFVKR